MALPPLTREHVMNCSITRWYPVFAAHPRGKCTIRSLLIDLPEDFVDYLLADGVVLPSTGPEEERHREDDAESWCSDADGEEEEEEEGEEQSSISLPSFPLLDAQISAAINELKGAAFPKLNWSSPKDAVWITGSLRCEQASDVYLLLKSSDFIVHDLCHAFEQCVDASRSDSVSERDASCSLSLTTDASSPSSSHPRPSSTSRSGFPVALALRSWSNLRSSMEFRCFVYRRRLIAITQRDCSASWDFLHEMKESLMERMEDFYEDFIENYFPEANFVMDLYVDQGMKVWLLDFNIFARQTDPLLFTWEEIAELLPLAESPEPSEDLPVFRLVQEGQGVRLNPLSGYRVPTDFMDHLVAEGGMEDFIEQCRREQRQQQQSEAP